MPYSANSDLPPAVRSKYSEHCQSVFRNVFNDVHDRTGDEGKAFAAAHAAAKKCEGSKDMTDDIEITGDLVSREVKFKFFTREWDDSTKSYKPSALKASRTADGKMRLHGVASSSTRDLHGDVMLPSAIEDMERAAANNMTIFLNHEYRVPEDVAGSVERATRVTRDRDHAGEPNVDLLLDIVVNAMNARAVETFQAIEGGTKLGLSIGAKIPKNGARQNKDGTYIIEHVELLETSLVGVPANPRSWVDYAVKALGGDEPVQPIYMLNNGGLTGTSALNSNWFVLSAPPTEIAAAACPSCGGTKGHPKNGCSDAYHAEAEIEITAESHAELPDSAFACVDSKGRHYPHHTASGGVDKALLRNALSRIGDKSNTQCGKGHLEAHAKELGIGDRGKDAVPDLIEATVDIHIDTDDGSSASNAVSGSSQEAGTSDPENGAAVLAEDAEGDNATLGDDVTKAITDVTPPDHVSLGRADFDRLLATVTETTRELIETKEALLAAKGRVEQAEKDRDKAIREQTRVLDGTKALIDRLANTPLVRRTAVTQAQTDFRARFGSIYDDDFLQIMENNQ